MSKEEFKEDCKGCRPAIMDLKTGKVATRDSPEMIAINRVWLTTTVEERQAFHSACCLNSRDPGVMALCQGLTRRIQAALDRSKN